MRNLREHPKGSGRYELTFYNKRRKPKRKYVRFEASSIHAAERIAFRKKEAYDKGEYDPWIAHRADDLQGAIAKYLDGCRDQAKSTYEGKKSTFNRFLEAIDYTSFSSITEDVIRQFASYYPNKNSLSTRLDTLNHFWKWAIDEEYTKTNPIAKFKRKNRTRKRKSAGKDRDAMTMEQYIQIYGEITAKASTGHYLPPFVELAISTGLRISEVVALNLRDVTTDGMTGSIQVREWIHPRTGHRFVPKTSDRVVPLVPRAAALCRSLLDSISSDDPWHQVFTNKHGNRPQDKYTSTLFSQARNRAGESKRITFHSTRHTFNSWLLMLDVNPNAVKKIMGHEDLKTQQRYTHFAEVMLSGGASQLRREIISFLCPGTPEDALMYAFPDTSNWYSSLGGGSRLPILDILFGNMLYDDESLKMARRMEMRRGLTSN